MESFVIGFVLQIIQHFVHNPTSAATFERELKAIRDGINVIFPTV